MQSTLEAVLVGAISMHRVILVCRFSGWRGIVSTEVLYVHIQLVIIRDYSFTKDLWVMRDQVI